MQIKKWHAIGNYIYCCDKVKSMEKLTLEGEPHLIVGCGRDLYKIIRELEFRGERRVHFTLGEDELVVNQNIRERYNEGIALAVYYDPCCENAIERVVDECRKYAKVSWHDYVTVDFSNMGKSYCLGEHKSVLVFSPRLFNKIIDH